MKKICSEITIYDIEARSRYIDQTGKGFLFLPWLIGPTFSDRVHVAIDRDTYA